MFSACLMVPRPSLSWHSSYIAGHTFHRGQNFLNGSMVPLVMQVINTLAGTKACKRYALVVSFNHLDAKPSLAGCSIFPSLVAHDT